MERRSWVEELRYVRQRPAMGLGTTETGHLDRGIHDPLWVLWETGAFGSATRAVVRAAPHHYHVEGYAEELRPEISRLVNWRGCDVLFHELLGLNSALLAEDAAWARPFHTPLRMFASFGCPMWLAVRGLVRIRTGEGTWSQAYERGWPVTPPIPTRVSGGASLVVAAHLEDPPFSGLPFTEERLRRAVPVAARAATEVAFTADNSDHAASLAAAISEIRESWHEQNKVPPGDLLPDPLRVWKTSST